MGSSGSTDQQSQQQSVSQTQLPPWINQAAQQNYSLAQNIANRPLTQFSGQQVADVAPQTQQAWNLAATSGGAGADQYNASQAGYLTAAGTPAQQVTDPGNASAITAGQLSNTNLQPYMNPFTNDVINSTTGLMQQQNALSQNQQANQANSANAFGGSRQGIQQGVAQAQGAMNIGQMASQLNQANFAQAQAAATGDINRTMAADTSNQQSQQTDLARNLQAQMANQTADQNNLTSLLQAAGGLGTLGSQAQQNQRQQFLELTQAGAGQQQQAQNDINAQMNQFNQANAYPGQQLGVLQSALGMTPYGSTTMGSSTGQQQTTTTPSTMADVTGALGALGSAFGTGGPFSQIGSSLGTALGGALSQSDRHLKTDIVKTGVHPPTGLPMYSYRYKGDPKSYPKVVGPMAEDAMQVAPHAVQTVGVHGPTGQAIHGVDMAALNAAGPPGGGMAPPPGLPPGAPSMRPQRMGGPPPMSMVPGALAPPSPMGVTGPMGASMRAPRMRPPTPRGMPRVAGGMRG